MADQGSIANLKQNINENIYDNTDYDITGGRMNTVLQNIVDTLNFNGRDFFNVNEYREKSDAYADAAAGRAAVPDEVKKIGLVITYLLADGWYIDEFIGSNISGWGTASNWKVLGPVSVTQNTSTGGYNLSIGGNTYNIASQDDMIKIITKLNNLADGKMLWFGGYYYRSYDGVFLPLASMACTDKYSSSYYEFIKAQLEEELSSEYTRMDLWKDGLFVGQRASDGWHNPDGTSHSGAIDFDTFAISVKMEDVPNYEDIFIIPSLADISELDSKLNNLADGRISVMDDVIKNSFDLLPNGFESKVGRYNNGVWHPETTNVTSLCPVSYAFYPQTLKDLKPYINSNPTPIFEFYFWGNGVYKGKGTKVDLNAFSYILPDGTITTLDQLGYIDTFSAGWLTADTETVMPYFKSPYNAINKRYIGRKYIALGDSITAGVRSDGISYAHLLNSKFKFIDFESKAVSQTSCMDITGRPHLATQVDALPNNYDGIITVMIGTNDCADGVNIGSVAETMSRDYANLSRIRSFADAFRQNIETIKRKCPLATIIVLMPVQNKPYEGTQISEANLEPIRECEREICRYLSVPYLNVNWECGITIYCNWDTLMYDAVHPNMTGQEVITQYLTDKFVGLFA